MKNFIKNLVLALVLILSILSFSACGNNNEAKKITNSNVLEEVRGVTIPKFSVIINDKIVTNEDLAEYSIYKSLVTSVNSSGTESTVNYIGFKFTDALKVVDLSNMTAYIEAIADDGYSVKYENRNVENMLIAISKDGSQFKKNPWFAPCDSNITGEFLQGLTTIFVNDKNEKPNVNTFTKPDDDSGNKELNKPEKLDRTDKVVFEPFSFVVNGIEITNDTLSGLKIYKITCDALNSKNAIITSTYTGYVLKEVLEKLDIDKNKKITAVASDGYKLELTTEQVNSEYTLIAIERDKELGKDGTVWVAPCEEDKTKKYANSVIEIIVE